MQPMPSFILIPGAGGMAWYWHRVVPLLEQAGSEAIAVDLPADDPSKGLDDYADIAIQAIGSERLNLEVQVIPGGHLVALSKPEELAALLLRIGQEVLRSHAGEAS